MDSFIIVFFFNWFVNQNFTREYWKLRYGDQVTDLIDLQQHINAGLKTWQNNSIHAIFNIKREDLYLKILCNQNKTK